MAPSWVYFLFSPDFMGFKRKLYFDLANHCFKPLSHSSLIKRVADVHAHSTPVMVA